jgi:hypothetical protein
MQGPISRMTSHREYAERTSLFSIVAILPLPRSFRSAIAASGYKSKHQCTIFVRGRITFQGIAISTLNIGSVPTMTRSTARMRNADTDQATIIQSAFSNRPRARACRKLGLQIRRTITPCAISERAYLRPSFRQLLFEGLARTSQPRSAKPTAKSVKCLELTTSSG